MNEYLLNYCMVGRQQYEKAQYKTRAEAYDALMDVVNNTNWIHAYINEIMVDKPENMRLGPANPNYKRHVIDNLSKVIDELELI